MNSQVDCYTGSIKERRGNHSKSCRNNSDMMTICMRHYPWDSEECPDSEGVGDKPEFEGLTSRKWSGQACYRKDYRGEVV